MSKPNNHQAQPYDASLKALLQEHTAEILQYLLTGARYVGELNCEVLKPQPPLRVDRAYRMIYRNKAHIFHLECQTCYNKNLPYRMLSYYSLLLERYRIPVISMIMFPFRTKLPKSPLRIYSGRQEISSYHFKVLPLWELNAEECINEQVIAMYPLLPTMHGANAALLLQAIEELALRYNGDRLSHRLVWFRTFLLRAKMLPPVEISRVEERLSMFDEILEQDPYFNKQVESRVATRVEAITKSMIEQAKAEVEARVKAEAEAKASAEKARAETSQRIMLTIVHTRFPELEELAREKVSRINKPDQLELLITQLAGAPDEQYVRLMLSLVAA